MEAQKVEIMSAREAKRIVDAKKYDELLVLKKEVKGFISAAVERGEYNVTFVVPSTYNVLITRWLESFKYTVINYSNENGKSGLNVLWELVQ